MSRESCQISQEVIKSRYKNWIPFYVPKMLLNTYFALNSTKFSLKLYYFGLEFDLFLLETLLICLKFTYYFLKFDYFWLKDYLCKRERLSV